MSREINQLPECQRINHDFPRWEAWVGLINGQWHARLKGSTPPVMVHDDNAEGIREQIERIEKTQAS